MQIALVAVVLLAGMWFAVLRPKSGGSSGPSATPAAAPVAPGVKGLANDVAKAKNAVAVSQAANQRTQAAAAHVGATDAPAAAKPAAAHAVAKPAATPRSAAAHRLHRSQVLAADPSTKLLAKLAHGKVVVLLFTSKGADDQAARHAVRAVAKRDHRVAAVTASIKKVGDYEAVTSGIQILTAPTVLVIGKDRKASTITGYFDAASLEQAVKDIRRGIRTDAQQ